MQRKKRREQGWRKKFSSCTLGFTRAKNFIPGKALSFLLSLSGKFYKRHPIHSCCSHTFTQPHRWRQTLYSLEFSTLFSSPAPLCRPKWTSPDSRAEQEGRTMSGVQGWLGSASRGCGLAPECMAADTTRHAAPDSVTSSTFPPFSFSVSPPLLAFYHFVSTQLLPAFLLLPPHVLLNEGTEFMI